jgi:hypothetical protein
MLIVSWGKIIVGIVGGKDFFFFFFFFLGGGDGCDVVVSN